MSETKVADAKASSEDRVWSISPGRVLLTKETAAEVMAPLLEAIKAGQVFDKISLSGKSFGEDAAHVAADVLKQLKGLKKVDFSDIIAGRHQDEARRVLTILCESIADQELEEINLSDNALGAQGVDACAPALRKQAGLRRLYFNNDGLQGDAAAKIRDLVLGSQPDGLSKLEAFEIFNNLLQDPGAKELAGLFSKSPNLQHLRFATTRLSAVGGLALAESLRELRQLRHLDLSDNTLGPKAGVILAGVVSRNPNLASVSLGDTGFGQKALGLLLQALAGNAKCLTSLCLPASEMGAALVPRLVACLRAAPGLRRLDLEGNRLKAAGAIAVVSALEDNTTLEHINLADNAIAANLNGNSVAAAIVKALANKKLKASGVNLGDNRFRSADVELLSGELKEALAELEAEEDEDEDEEESEEEEEEEEEEDEEVSALAEQLAKQLDTAGEPSDDVAALAYVVRAAYCGAHSG